MHQKCWLFFAKYNFLWIPMQIVFFRKKYQAEFLIFFFQFEYCREMLLHASQSLDERKTRISRQKKVKKTQQFSFPCLGWWQNSTILSLQWQPENCRIDFVLFHSFILKYCRITKFAATLNIQKEKGRLQLYLCFLVINEDTVTPKIKTESEQRHI